MADRRQTIKNTPKKIQQITAENTQNYIADRPAPAYPDTNRANEVSSRGDKFVDFTVGMEDINEAVMFYFNEVIQPYIFENGTKLNVPVMYANPERFKASQVDGLYRDVDGKMMFPAIILNRTSIDKVRNIGNKLDGNKVHNYATYEKRFSSKNAYDNFSILTNRIPVKEYHNVIIPDYYKIRYACSIYVNFLQDLDRIIEAIGQYSYSYWGREGKFKFMAAIDSFQTRTEISQGSDRVIICNFELILNGYLTPKDINREMASTRKFLSKAQLIFISEISSNIETFNMKIGQKAKAPSINVFPESITVTNVNSGGGVDPLVLAYLNQNLSCIATYQTGNSASFLNTLLLAAPSGFTNGVNNFNFFINGQHISNPNAIISFVENGSNVDIVFNTTLLGYNIETTDEIIGVGKWNNTNI